MHSSRACKSRSDRPPRKRFSDFLIRTRFDTGWAHRVFGLPPAFGALQRLGGGVCVDKEMQFRLARAGMHVIRFGEVDIAALKQRVSILQVLEMLQLGGALRAEGERLLGCCPIHKGSDEREFIVTPGKGLWYCHGQCSAAAT